MNDPVQTEHAEQDIPLTEPRVIANIKLLDGRIVQVGFPHSLTDDDLCLVIMEMAKNLRVKARAEQAAAAAAKPSGLVVARVIPRLDG